MRLNSVVLSARLLSILTSAIKTKNLRRKIIVCLLCFSLLSVPVPAHAITRLSTVIASATDVISLPVTFVPSILRHLLGQTAIEQEETLADRLARVSQIRLSPSTFVAYEGQTMIFTAIGSDTSDRVIQGVGFSWESADSTKVEIDSNGQARFQQPGETEIICRAGSAQATARVLVRPGQRPQQTDEEWRRDQEALRTSVSTGIGSILPTVINKMMPTAQAQGGGYAGVDAGFDAMWSEPQNLSGNPRNRILEPMALGSVLPESNNFNFALPLVALGGRGKGAHLNLYYNSRVWSRNGSVVSFAPIAGFPFAGFSLGLGRIVTYGTTSDTKYVLVDPDGTTHYLGSGNASTNATYQTTDGTHITYVGSATTGGSLYYSDGTKITIGVYNNRLLATEIKDSNGNYIQVAYKSGVASPLAIDYVTDSKGRQIQFNYDTSGYLISITAPGYGGTAQNPVTRTVVEFDYEARTLSYTFNGLTVTNVPSGQVQVVKHIRFPGTSTGYLFTYSDYGMAHTVSRRRQMTINGSGVISDGTESAYVSFNYPTSGSTQLTDAPAFTQRTESPGGSYTYSSSTNSLLKTKTYTVFRPDSSNLVFVRSTDSLSVGNGLLKQKEITKNSISYSRMEMTYTTDGGSNVQPETITTYDDAGVPTKMDFSYDAYGNVTDKREYGTQISSAWAVRRRTHFTYKTDTTYLNAYLRSLPTLIEVFDALENTSDGDDVLIAKTANTYDDYSATGGMVDRTPKPPGHDSAVYTTSNTVRGNLTGMTEWTDIAGNVSLPTRLKKYDRMGNLVQEQVSCCKEKNFDYDSADYWANPPTVTDGNPSGLHISGTASYDFNTDLPKWTEYANLGKRHFYYDAALRLIEKELPVGGDETITYNDAAMTVTETKPGQGSSTRTYDGWGRTLQQTNPHGGQVNASYDTMGRMTTETNPFQAGGSPTAQTTYTYDALGRATVMTLPDSQTVQTTYSGMTVTTTDQVGRQIKRETDGLGRLSKVVEQDNSTGNLTQETTYTYNLLDKLTGVNQGNQLRAYKYDALGRLLFERQPEQTATINDGSGTYWTTKYTYTDFHAIATRTDARGVITTYSYDNLNRLIGISYNTSGATGVATTTGVGYTYDNNNSSPTNGLLLSAGNGVVETYDYDTYKRLESLTRTIDSTDYETTYQYGTGNLRSQVAYPSARVVNLNRDSAGRLTSLTDGSSANYLSSLTYNYGGAATGLTLGNGVVEAYGFDADRLQLTSQTATKSGNTLLSLTYGYAATSGQNGTNTTAGNTGQLMSISGAIGGQTESAAYTYDLQNRLVTSSQTSNGVSAQRRFTYDRWGNRTNVHNATSGGTQIQFVNLQQSSGVPTNRFTSIAQGLSLKNYTYDNAGNVTSDGINSYTYDAENRVVSVNSGSTATYAYDHHSHRVKKTVGSAVTHYVWEGDQVIAEYDATSGSSLQTEYVYLANRMIARFASGTTHYFLNDKLSARLILDSSGAIVGRQAHLPYGEELNATGTTDKHRMTSYERDAETGNDYAINRGYTANIGRFNQSDPYAESSASAFPQSLNRYAYVQNDPVNNIDRLGLSTCATYGVFQEYYVPATGQVISRTLISTYTLCSGEEKAAGGGGGGNSQGKIGVEKANKNLKKQFKSFLDDSTSKTCRDKLTKAYGNDFLKKIKSAIDTVPFIDVQTIWDDFARIYYPDIVNFGFPDAKIRDIFTPGTLPGLPLIQAFTIPKDAPKIGPVAGIYVIGGASGPFWDQDIGGMFNLMHEISHYLGKTDQDLVRDLAIPISNNQSATEAVSLWFQNKCQ